MMTRPRRPGTRRTETRSERHARQAAQALKKYPPGSVQTVEVYLASKLARRRHVVLVVLVVSALVCALTTFVTSRIVAGYRGEDLTWWTSVGSRYVHHTETSYIATSDATLFAMKQTMVPVILVALSYVALWLPRVRGWTLALAPVWIGAYLMPGLAIGVIADFYGSVLGQHAGDLLPAVAMISPEGLPMFAFFCVGIVVVLFARLRQRGRSRTTSPAAARRGRAATSRSR